MDKNELIFQGSIQTFNEDKKTVEAIILHFGVANLNNWMAMPKCFDAFLSKLKEADKRVPAYYQHNGKEVLIGSWELEVDDNIMKGTLHLSDVPFVRDTVIPQLKDKTLQGSSPTAIPTELTVINGVNSIVQGMLEEISLVGLPADLYADITKLAAKVEEQKNEQNNFEIDLLTLR